MSKEPEIINHLFSNWISLALEYANDAPDIRGIYVYASSEMGSTFVNMYFDQGGKVIFPDELPGAGVGKSKLRQAVDLLFDDLFAAQEAYRAISVPFPTEYRVFFETATRKLDATLSREIVYHYADGKSPEHGIEYWLGERAPKLF